MQNVKYLKFMSTLFSIFLFFCAIPSNALSHALSGKGNLANGEKQWTNNCARCHNLRSPSEYDSRSWQPIMLHMRAQSGVSGQTARDIYTFLLEQTQSASAQPQTPLSHNDKVITIAARNSEPDLADNTPKTDVIPQLKKTVPPTNPKPKKSISHLNAKTTKTTSNPTTGKSIYMHYCIACHGSNGKGSIPGAPDFTESTGPLKNSDAVLLGRIIKGYHGKGALIAMPPRGGNPQLTNDELKAALKFIRQQFGK